MEKTLNFLEIYKYHNTYVLRVISRHLEGHREEQRKERRKEGRQIKRLLQYIPNAM